MKRWILAAACGVVALGLLLYPLVGELLNEKYHSDVETTYTAAIEDTDDAELTAQRQAAEQYNAMLSGATITEGGASAPPLAYAQQLTVGGVMAYVDIPKISVYLPVQHGTDADTLENSVGQVDNIATVLPTDTSLLQIEEGKEFVTLVTCTPFGVNTHRLLVRGYRVPYLPEQEAAAAEEKPAASSWTRHYLTGLTIGLGVVAAIGGGYFLVRRFHHA